MQAMRYAACGASRYRTIVGVNCSEGDKEEKEEDPMTEEERMEREREREISPVVR